MTKDTYHASIVFRATWAGKSYWTTDTPGRQDHHVHAPAGDLANASIQRIESYLVDVGNSKAKTNSVSQQVNGFFSAEYADERKADGHFSLNIRRLEETTGAFSK